MPDSKIHTSTRKRSPSKPDDLLQHVSSQERVKPTKYNTGVNGPIIDAIEWLKSPFSRKKNLSKVSIEKGGSKSRRTKKRKNNK
jgi:hypothetical protein